MKQYIAILNKPDNIPFDIVFESTDLTAAIWKARYLYSEYFECVGRWNMDELSVFEIEDIKPC